MQTPRPYREALLLAIRQAPETDIGAQLFTANVYLGVLHPPCEACAVSFDPWAEPADAPSDWWPYSVPEPLLVFEGDLALTVDEADLIHGVMTPRQYCERRGGEA